MERDRNFEIKVGLFVAMGVVLFLGTLIALGSEQNLFERNYPLQASFKNISGLRTGAAVRLAGMDVGLVTRVRFSTDLDTKEVEIRLRVAERFRERIRSDSVATIKTQGVLGDKYILLTLGSQGEALNDGSWVVTEEPEDLLDKVPEIKERILSIAESIDVMLKGDDGASAGKSIVAIVDSIRRILKEVEEGRGIVHSLVYDKEPARQLQRTLKGLGDTTESVAALTEEIRSGDGSLNTLIYGDELGELVGSLKKTTDDIDSVIVAITEGDGVLHSLVYEKEGMNLIDNLTDASQDIKEMIAAVQDGQGTLGALIADPTVYEDIKTLLGGAKRNKILKSYVRDTIRKNERDEGLSDAGRLSE